MTEQTQDPLRVWRVESLDIKGRRRPLFGHIEQHSRGKVIDSFDLPTDPRSAFDVTASACAHGYDHQAPAPRCTCGVFGVIDVRELRLILRAVEFPTPVDLDPKPVRFVISEGLLHNWIPGWSKSRHRAIPLYEDGTTGPRPAVGGFGGLAGVLGGFSFAGISYNTPPPPPPRLLGFGVTGDPAGSFRGTHFTCERIFIRAKDRGWAAKAPVPVIAVPGNLEDAVAAYGEETEDRANWWEPTPTPIEMETTTK